MPFHPLPPPIKMVSGPVPSLDCSGWRPPLVTPCTNTSATKPAHVEPQEKLAPSERKKDSMSLVKKFLALEAAPGIFSCSGCNLCDRCEEQRLEPCLRKFVELRPPL